MKKIFAIFLGLGICNSVLAEDGSPELKSESQAVFVMLVINVTK
ncbi:hypothetical protein ACVXHB_26870 [Escherichia coli]